ncbi:MAG: tryptophan-rich sensory protein [Alistipes sp.]|nr:tryptophan-rich sensory protein [Alistipes sp.]
MRKILSFAIPVLLCFAVGVMGSYVQSPSIEEWYPTLQRSVLTPPNIIFPIAWSVIYLLMGLSLGVLLVRGDMSLVRLWLLQLLVNFLWSVFFFSMRSPLAGLITILLLDVLVFAYLIYAFSRSALSAWLWLPYMAWMLFATYLNGYIYLHNNSAQQAVAQTTTTAPALPTKTTHTMNYTMPTLPYEADALAPLMSKETLDYHYGKHLQTYVDNLNRLIVGTPYEGMMLDAIVVKADGPLFNNAAQVWNHTLFFDTLTPTPSTMPQPLKEAIERDFGSVDAFKERFTAAATSLFGSGWVWLVRGKDGRLAIVSTQNADNPMRQGLQPLLVLDVWEHAYYIDHRNRRADFVKGWWQLVDWDKVAKKMKQGH